MFSDILIVLFLAACLYVTVKMKHLKASLYKQPDTSGEEDDQPEPNQISHYAKRISKQLIEELQEVKSVTPRYPKADLRKTLLVHADILLVRFYANCRDLNARNIVADNVRNWIERNTK